jgi:hypothetical protein
MSFGNQFLPYKMMCTPEKVKLEFAAQPPNAPVAATRQFMGRGEWAAEMKGTGRRREPNPEIEPDVKPRLKWQIKSDKQSVNQRIGLQLPQ